MKTKLLAVAVFSTLASVAAMADGPSFNMIEGGYTDIEDADGFMVRGSVELTDQVYFTGSYANYSDEETDDLLGVDLNLGITTIGVGLQQAISDTTSLYGQIEYLDYSLELDYGTGSAEDSEDGYQLSAGVRSMVSEKTEFYGELAHRDILEESVSMAKVGVRQYFTDNLGVFAEVNADDNDSNGYAVGVTYKF